MLWRFLKRLRVRGGVINAFTSEEVTCFWNKMPSKHFGLSADIGRDLVLNPLFEAEALERERKVILEEIKMYHDNPSTHVLEKIKEMLYEGPFNMSIAGTSKSVKGLSREKVVELFDSIYSTNNMIFSVVGDTNWDEVLEEAKKFPKMNKKISDSEKKRIFSLTQKNEALSQSPTRVWDGHHFSDIPIVLKNGEMIEKRKGIDQAHLVLGFHMPKLGDKNRYAGEIFDSVLGGGMSSRLFQEIREKRGLCYAIKSNLEQSKDYSYEMIYAGTVKEKVNEIRELVLKEIGKIGDLKKADFEEVKERLIGLRSLGKEKSDLTMMELLQEELGGDASKYYEYEEEISKIKLKDVQDLSKLSGYSFVALVPE